MFGLNKNIKGRDAKLFGAYEPNEYMGGIRYYKGLTVDDLEWLLENNYIEPNEAQNNAPSVQEFYGWMQLHPSFKAHGYAVDIKRDDYRISIEGVNKGGSLSPEEVVDFVDMFRFADDMDIEHGYCWYD